MLLWESTDEKTSTLSCMCISAMYMYNILSVLMPAFPGDQCHSEITMQLGNGIGSKTYTAN